MDDSHATGYGVEPELLLRYLIEKSEELTHKNYSGFPSSFRGLGVVVLTPFPELQEEFVKIVRPSEDPVSERAKMCREIFSKALRLPQELREYENSEDGENTCHSTIANRFAWAARREGEEMVERNDFRFLPIWEMLSFIALHADPEKFRDFQEKCLLYTDPAERIEAVVPILWEAIRAKMKRH